MWYATETGNWQIIARVMNLKFDEKDPHYFEISKWFWDKKEILSEDANKINGKLVKIELGDYEWNKQTIKTMDITIDDNGERLVRQTTYNNLSRNAIYCLAGLDVIDQELFLTLYVSKEKGNKNVWVKHGMDDLKNWFDREKDIKARTKAVMDWEEFVKYSYKELDAWIDETLIPKINDAVADKDLLDELETVEKKPAKAPKKAEKKVETPDDSLPF